MAHIYPDKGSKKSDVYVYDHSRIEEVGYVKQFNYIIYDSRFSATDKFVYSVLKSFAYHGNCFPGKETLCKHSGVSINTLNTSMSVLAKHGLIEVIKRDGYTNIYALKSMREVYFEESPDTGLKLKDFFASDIHGKGASAVKIFENIVGFKIEKPKPVEEENQVAPEIKPEDQLPDANTSNLTTEERIEVYKKELAARHLAEQIGRVGTITKANEKAVEQAAIVKQKQELRSNSRRKNIEKGLGSTVESNPESEPVVKRGYRKEENTLTTKYQLIEDLWIECIHDYGLSDKYPILDRFFLTKKDIQKIKEFESIGKLLDLPEYIDRCLSDWSNICMEFDIEGAPSMSILWGFKGSLWTRKIGASSKNSDAQKKKYMDFGEHKSTGESKDEIGVL